MIYLIYTCLKKVVVLLFGVWRKIENNWLKREVGLSLKIAILWGGFVVCPTFAKWRNFALVSCLF